MALLENSHPAFRVTGARSAGRTRPEGRLPAKSQRGPASVVPLTGYDALVAPKSKAWKQTRMVLSPVTRRVAEHRPAVFECSSSVLNLL